MKKLFLLATLAMCGLTSQAQSASERLDYKPAPYLFVGVQGGGQTTFTNFDQLKLVTPTASVSFGAFFTPTVGARLHVNGIWNKGGIKPDFKYNYRYVTTDLDLLLNLCTLFGRQDYYPLNVYLIGGVGLNYAWDNDDLVQSPYNQPFAWEDHRLSHNARVGAMLDYNLCKNLSVNLEVSANSLSDRYNSKLNQKDDWQLTAQVGLAYKFGFKAKEKAAPIVCKPYVAEPEVEKPVEKPVQQPVEVVKPAEQPAQTAAAAVVKPEMHTEIFYAIRETVATGAEQQKVQELVKFLKANPEAKVSVIGYADAGTGNDDINTRLARQRAENIVKTLKGAGIAPGRITSDSKGDNIQPYRENDKNRVVIAVAK